MTHPRLETASIQIPIKVQLPDKSGIPNDESLELIRNCIEQYIPYTLSNWLYLESFNVLKMSFEVKPNQISLDLVKILHRDIDELLFKYLIYN